MAGLILTPLPWKLLDESAKWTQNWSWIPVPPKGRINYKYTACTLCPMGCGVRVRCVENRPVGLSGIAGDPVGAGSLCAMGIAGHLLRYHPSRLLHPLRRVGDGTDTRLMPIAAEDAASDIARAISSENRGSVAIMDMQPSRTLSYIYRRFLGLLNEGVYINPPSTSEIPAGLIYSVLHCRGAEFGFDAENARTILSFGTPVLDGWGTPGQFKAITEAMTRSGNSRLRITQVESAHSRTAQLADEWIPVKPGTEGALALGLSHVLLAEGLCDIGKLRERSEDFDNGSGRSFRELTKRFSPANVGAKTGIPAEKIAGIARELAANKPSLIVFGGSHAGGPFSLEEQILFMDLNILLGAVGTKGELVARGELPGPLERNDHLVDETQLVDLPDHSIKVLIIDGADSGDAMPWSLIRQKLVATNPIVISFASHLAGAARHADYLLPSPGYMETTGDLPSPASASLASYRITRQLDTSRGQSAEPLEFLKRMAAMIAAHPDPDFQSMTTEGLIKRRIDRIFSGRRGFVFDPASGETTKLSRLAGPRLHEIMEHGGCWTDERAERVPSMGFSFLGLDGASFDRIASTAERDHGTGTLTLVPVGTRGAGTIAQENTIMTKLYRESDLMKTGNTVSINPVTGKERGLTDGAVAAVTTESGSARVTVRLDASVMPGVLEASVGPAPRSFERVEPQNDDAILDICKIESNSTWRLTSAEISPA